VLLAAGSWHLRGCIIPTLQLLAYRGQFCELTNSHRDTIRALLHQLILDTQVEVREASWLVTSGFVQLHGPTERDRTLEWATRHSKKKSTVVERHAAALSLSGLMMLAPYDVPAWLPDVVERLAKFSNEPQPIKRTVTKAFQDFKRTHQDNWSANKLRFTEEQQEIIANTQEPPPGYV